MIKATDDQRKKCGNRVGRNVGRMSVYSHRNSLSRRRELGADKSPMAENDHVKTDKAMRA